MNINAHNNPSFTSKARRFTRRLSYGITKVIRDWNNDSNDSNSCIKSSHIDKNPRVFDIDELVLQTKFTRSEIQFIYRDFKLKCPNGILTEKSLIDIYSQLFSCGDCTIYAKHLFSAMTQQPNKLNGKNTNEINFRDFLVALSSIMRGSLDDRIKWLFNFYDINKDGLISHEEIGSIIRSLYDLMGQNVNPPVDEYIKNQHIDSVLQKFGLDLSNDTNMSFNEFHTLFSSNQQLVESMMNVF